MKPSSSEALDLAMDTLGSHLVVCDVIMNPPQTNLLRTAAFHGATVLDGRVDTAVLCSTLDAILQS